MWLAPAFHHGPRPLVAERHARSSVSPRCIRLRARAYGRFHCRHRTQRSLCRIQPSRSSSARLVSVSLKYAAHPRSTGLRRWIVVAKASPARAAQLVSHLLRQLLHARLSNAQLRPLMPRHAVAQKLPLPRPRHRALGLIHLELQSLGQKPGHALQQVHTRPFAADIDVAVVRVPAECVPASSPVPGQAR